MKICSFNPAFFSQTQFAEIIGRSRTEINLLIKMGVVQNCTAGVIACHSFDSYFNCYLPPNKRNEELNFAFHRIAKKFNRKSKIIRGLNSVRAIKQEIISTQKLFTAAKFLNRLSSENHDLILKLEQKIKTLQQKFLKVQKKIFEKITSAKLPAEIENILIYRYCDCETFKECADISGYSLSHVYTLHRRGKSLLKAKIRK